jgi:hypothetical protein
MEGRSPEAKMMNPVFSDYSDAEIAQRGEAIYHAAIASQVEGMHHGEIVAIDVETGQFAIGKNSLTASDQLLERYPKAQIWLVQRQDIILG